MRRLLSVALLAAVFAAPPAVAGEGTPLGVITSGGTSITNETTATPFAITPGSKVTIQCDAAAYVLVDASSVATSGATRGLKLQADQALPTSIPPRSATTVTIGGTKSARIAVISASGTANCYVFPRAGDEAAREPPDSQLRLAEWLHRVEVGGQDAELRV